MMRKIIGTPNLSLGQMIGELRLRGVVQRFQHHAVGIGAVAGEAADHRVLFLITQPNRRAGGNRHAAADNRVRAEMPDGEIGDVHRAAAALAIAVFLAEQFANHAIDVLFKRGFEQFLVLRCFAIRHALISVVHRSFRGWRPCPWRGFRRGRGACW